jgi:hypothetical protein
MHAQAGPVPSQWLADVRELAGPGRSSGQRDPRMMTMDGVMSIAGVRGLLCRWSGGANPSGVIHNVVE